MNPGYIDNTIREAIQSMNIETQLALLIANDVIVEVKLVRSGVLIVSYFGMIKQPSKFGLYYLLASRRGGATNVAYEFKLERVKSIVGSNVVINML